MERDRALGNLQRLADFRSRLAARREDQTLALAVAEKPVPSTVELSRRPKPVDTPPREARGRVVDGARDELAIRERREDMAFRCGAAASGAVSVPANREIIEPDFMNRPTRLGETAAEHEVTEAKLLGDE